MSEDRDPGLGESGEHPLSVLLFSWMRSKRFALVFTWLLAIVGLGLVGLEMLVATSPAKDPTATPGFHGAFGVVAFAFAVLSGWPLGWLLRRREDHYDTRSGEAGRDD